MLWDDDNEFPVWVGDAGEPDSLVGAEHSRYRFGSAGDGVDVEVVLPEGISGPVDPELDLGSMAQQVEQPAAERARLCLEDLAVELFLGTGDWWGRGGPIAALPARSRAGGLEKVPVDVYLLFRNAA